jgi:uncharacterized membrane protein YfhO
MYTSIPQNGENWSVTVDGREAEISLVGNAMIGVQLTKGNHEIVFTYRNPSFELGWKVSLVCLLIFGGLAVLYYRPWLYQRKKGKYER